MRRRALATVDFALSQCRDVDLHPTPSFCAETVLHGRVSERCVSRPGGPSGQPDTDDDHVERYGDDGRDLLINDNVSVGLFSLAGMMGSPYLEPRIDRCFDLESKSTPQQA
jgi:hypothetical protein